MAVERLIEMFTLKLSGVKWLLGTTGLLISGAAQAAAETARSVDSFRQQYRRVYTLELPRYAVWLCL